jgi:hypothetical protein
MNLSLKGTRFVIAALEHYQRFHDDQLRQEGSSEDDASDLANDRQYLQVIKEEFEKHQQELSCRHAASLEAGNTYQ